MQMMIKLQNHRKQGFPIIFFDLWTSHAHDQQNKRSISNSWIYDITSRLTYHGLFFHHILSRGKDTSSMTPMISFLMFFAKAFNYIQAKIIIIN
jgi:hypothetical protein